MISKSPEDLQKKILDKLTFLPHSNENNIIYKNIEKPELGYLIKYSRPRYYDFIIGNYTIPSNFSFSFHHSQEIIRFGTMYVGNTSFEIENNPTLKKILRENSIGKKDKIIKVLKLSSVNVILTKL